jgi:hypothetical protein
MKNVIKSQYYAALTMLEDAIRQCKDELWLSDACQHEFWWVAYHTLFFADCYLSPSQEAFVPWEKHVVAFEGLVASTGTRSVRAATLPSGQSPYTQTELLDYTKLIFARMSIAMEKAELDAPSGFFWLPFNKLEVQLYNIRHIQHHTGQLIERIRQNQDEGVAWVFCDKHSGKP